MKVALHVDQLWFGVPGGIGTYVRELLGGIREVEPSFELTPFHSSWRGDPPGTPFTVDGRLGVRMRWPIAALYPAWGWLRWPPLPRALSAHDLVHATNPAAVPPVRRGQRSVVTVHDLAFERFPDLFPRRWRSLYRRGLSIAIDSADALIVPSESVRRELAEHHAVPGERVHVTPLAPPARTLGPETIAVGRAELAEHGVARPYVLAVGTLEPRKNLVRLLRAYRLLAREGFPHDLVLLGGEGWRADEVRAEIARGGPGRVVRPGVVAPTALAAAYADADAVAYVSLYEGFGLPVLEAMAAGAPVIASDRSSIPEVAGSGAAVLVDPEDVDAVADALRRVLSDPSLAGTLRRRGLRRAGAFSWAATARATLDVYRDVLGAT